MKDIISQLLNNTAGFLNRQIFERFTFRDICSGEEEQAVDIEQICFPPHEACSEKHMKERMKVAADLFLVAIDKENGKIAGFLNGIATGEAIFRDEFFVDAALHQADGRNIMLLGLDVLPEYRKQGLAHEIVYQYLKREKKRGRQMLTLTCLDGKVKFYEKMGFTDRGLSNSTWGNEAWHEMTYVLEKNDKL